MFWLGRQYQMKQQVEETYSNLRAFSSHNNKEHSNIIFFNDNREMLYESKMSSTIALILINLSSQTCTIQN